MIIGISGRKGSGKSTLAEALAKWMQCLVIGFADPIKELCEDLYPDVPFAAWWGTEEDKRVSRPALNGHTSREVMQNFGGDMRRYDPLCWVRLCMGEAKTRTNCIIGDVRFREEVDAIHAAGGYVIRLMRNPYPDDNHISETSLDHCTTIDLYIDSDTAEDAARIAKAFVWGRMNRCAA